VNQDEWNACAAIEAEFPGWEAWTSLDGQWHARIKQATPPVMVHAGSAEELAEKIRATHP
jgi:hypothetical protein